MPEPPPGADPVAAARARAARPRHLRWLAGLALGVGYLELFRLLDFGQGPWRALLVAGLAAAAWAALSRTGPAPAAPAWLLPAAGLFLLVNVASGVEAVAQTVRTGEVRQDQGQAAVRALGYLRRGADPYATTAMLDPVSLQDLDRRLSARPGCRARPAPPELDAALARHWREADPRSAARDVPAVRDAPGCRGLALDAASLGYKYGPALLAVYAPFVLSLGKPGVHVAHLALLLLAVALVLSAGRARGASWVLAAGALLPLLAPSHLRHDVLDRSASDLAPALAAAAALALRARGRHGWAALLLGLSVACKPLPGLLYAPLLLGAPRWCWAAFLAPVAAALAPFAAWDAAGLVDDLVLFNLRRPTDSTALAHFLPHAAAAAAQLLALGALLAALARARARRWAPRPVLAYLWVAHAAVLATGPVFHNNYLTWLLPLASLTFLEALAPTVTAAGPGPAAAPAPPAAPSGTSPA